MGRIRVGQGSGFFPAAASEASPGSAHPGTGKRVDIVQILSKPDGQREALLPARSQGHVMDLSWLELDVDHLLCAQGQGSELRAEPGMQGEVHREELRTLKAMGSA